VRCRLAAYPKQAQAKCREQGERGAEQGTGDAEGERPELSLLQRLQNLVGVLFSEAGAERFGIRCIADDDGIAGGPLSQLCVAVRAGVLAGSHPREGVGECKVVVGEVRAQLTHGVPEMAGAPRAR